MNIIEQWDEAANPGPDGMGNSGGFALEHWREIRTEVEFLRSILEDANMYVTEHSWANEDYPQILRLQEILRRDISRDE